MYKDVGPRPVPTRLSCWRSSSCLQVLLPDLHDVNAKTWGWNFPDTGCLDWLVITQESLTLSPAEFPNIWMLKHRHGKKTSWILVGYQMLSKSLKKNSVGKRWKHICASQHPYTVPFSLLIQIAKNGASTYLGPWTTQHLEFNLDQSCASTFYSFQAFIQAPRKLLQYLHDFGTITNFHGYLEGLSLTRAPMGLLSPASLGSSTSSTWSGNRIHHTHFVHHILMDAST